MEGEPGQDQPDHRVDQRNEDHVGAQGAEILEARFQRFAQIRGGEVADLRLYVLGLTAQMRTDIRQMRAGASELAGDP